MVEHFRGRHRTDALRFHHDVLRPGGIAIVSVPHAHCPTYRLWKLYLEKRGWWPYGMEIPYSKRELSQRARDAGFDRAEVVAQGFWQSVGDHICKSLLHSKVDLSRRTSILDNVMGMTALCFAWRANQPEGRR